MVEVVVLLRKKGHKVVLVSSGAIVIGLARMDMSVRPKHLAKTQVSVFVLEFAMILIPIRPLQLSDRVV